MNLTDDLLELAGLDLAGGETILLSIDTLMSPDISENAVISARFFDPVQDAEVDDSQSTPIAVFRSSFEDE